MSDILHVNNGCIELIRGNIIEQVVDAIVNAANTKLLGGGGVDGAIHRAAGPRLKEECLKLPADEKGRRCQTGDVRVTAAGKLQARWVIHAVGPFYNAKYADKASEQLQLVHERALEEANRKKCRSVAFPAISTGAYRFPKKEAAAIAMAVAKQHLEQTASAMIVRFVLFNQGDLEVFRAAMKGL